MLRGTDWSLPFSRVCRTAKSRCGLRRSRRCGSSVWRRVRRRRWHSFARSGTRRTRTVRSGRHSTPRPGTRVFPFRRSLSADRFSCSAECRTHPDSKRSRTGLFGSKTATLQNRQRSRSFQVLLSYCCTTRNSSLLIPFLNSAFHLMDNFYFYLHPFLQII